MTTSESKPADFLRQIVANDVSTNKHGGAVVTRFPPEPNGYLHIGHAKSITLNFGIASEHAQGRCHLRFDDTNPLKEEVEYADAIEEDVRWLGFDWGEHKHYASDYFQQLYDYAVQLIRDGKAYVDSLSAEQIREYRGTLTEPGRPSPYRDRSVEENLDLFDRMRTGEFEDGAHVLRAKIDMASPNINLRDPAIYRIRNVEHPRTGNTWSIYPMYDYAHCISDAIEGITHSICTLEFEDHRPLYNWFLDQLPVPSHPQQIEFARMNVSYFITSKRKLLQLVNDGHVAGWDDPRMPTIAGIRRLGFPAAAVREFCDRVGTSKRPQQVDMAMLEHCVRDELNRTSPRVMGVLDPLKVVIENFPDGETDELEAVNNPEDELAGVRTVPFSKTLYIERADFMEDPPRKFFRLGPGREVRLRWAYFITCTDVIKDDNGTVVELRCTYDPATRGGDAPDGRKVKGTLHWVSADHAIEAEVRMYDRLFAEEIPGKSGEFLHDLNPQSLTVLERALVEPSVRGAAPGTRFQFERQGYFCVDRDSTDEKPVFNRTLPLRDKWAKISGNAKG